MPLAHAVDMVNGINERAQRHDSDLNTKMFVNVGGVEQTLTTERRRSGNASPDDIFLLQQVMRVTE